MTQVANDKEQLLPIIEVVEGQSGQRLGEFWPLETKTGDSYLALAKLGHLTWPVLPQNSNGKKGAKGGFF